MGKGRPLGHDGYGWLMMALFWVLVIGGIALVFKLLVRGSKSEPGGDGPVEILRKRCARGEISKTKYEEKLKDLGSIPSFRREGTEMKRVLVVLVLVAVSVVPVNAQMGGGMMGQGMMPGMMGQGQGQSPGMPAGMMGQGSEPCTMMGQGMMPGGMMGAGMMTAGAMPCMMMGQMMGGAMPAKSKACIGMSGMMMSGSLDLPQMQKSLGLTAEQEGKLSAIQRSVQREAIRIGADMKLAELDLADLLSAESVDMGKVEGKLKELESLRTRMALNHLKSSEEVKKVLGKEQLEKFQGMCAACRQDPQAAPKVPPAGSPQGEDPHHQKQ